MAALPYMPLYVADYLADAAHLTTFQHGAYLLLIMTYWQRGQPLPNDDAKLARICRMTAREWARNREVLSDFFAIDEHEWKHKRIAHELARVADKSLKAKRAGSTSAQRRLEKRSTDADRTPNHTDTDTSIPEDKSSGGELQSVDAETVMWRHGKLYLQSQGIKPDKAGALLGKWRKEYGAESVIVALGRAQREGAIDPVSFIEGCFRQKAPDRQPVIGI